MASRKEFLAEIETIHGYKADEWQPIGKVSVPTGVAIFTIGKDEEGYFTHINKEFGKWTIEPMKNMGVTHWQMAKYYDIYKSIKGIDN